MAKNSASAQRIDQFFAMHSGRTDRWRDLAHITREWADGRKQRADVEAAREALSVLETFYAYPGARVLSGLDECIAEGNAAGAAALARRISNSLLTRAYRSRPGEWDLNDEMSEEEVADVMPPALGERGARRPYFEVLFVTSQPASRWPALAAELRRLRRPEDAFVYEAVIVGSLEDAFCAAAVNPALAAAVLFEGFPYRSRHDAPALRTILEPFGVTKDTKDTTLLLATALKRIRPELDVYLVSDRDVERLAGDPATDCVRRVFYGVEEFMEQHLAILEGVQARFETPFFDNLRKYATRPIGTFHALPIARGKSIFKSDWIRDMGEFYGINLFLAESSATTGGLDSLLEPTGNIKRAQEMAARAFGADHVFFVTNGTSTSNKMVEQALLAPGDIMLVDRNCHKSHHYGAVIAGALPLYVEAYPLTQYSMYGAVPLRTIKKALLGLKAEGQLDRARLLVLTNCTFDGHIYNVERVMEECLAIKPDLIFLWDEAWFGFARWSPYYRRRTAMGAAAILERKFKEPVYRQAYNEQQRKLGANPSDNEILETRLLANPDKARVRVYQTNSTHKSMSSLRQGSMVLVKDPAYHTVEEQFHEAVFTHASTSPNLQIIASLDVARRQMELEGYDLVNRAIQLALDVRREVNSHPLVSKYFRVLGADE